MSQATFAGARSLAALPIRVLPMPAGQHHQDLSATPLPPGPRQPFQLGLANHQRLGWRAFTHAQADRQGIDGRICPSSPVASGSSSAGQPFCGVGYRTCRLGCGLQTCRGVRHAPRATGCGAGPNQADRGAAGIDADHTEVLDQAAAIS
jgi:hypothetical protein